MEALRALFRQIEDATTHYVQPLRPHLSSIGAFLVVAGLVADASRITTEWGDQLWYLQKYHGFSGDLARLFLAASATTLLGGSFMVTFLWNVEYAAAALVGVCLVHGFVYDILRQPHFWLSTLGYAEGLEILLIDTAVKRGGLSQERRNSLLAAGRALLLLMFVGVLMQCIWSLARLVLLMCLMVVAGRAPRRWSAAALALWMGACHMLSTQTPRQRGAGPECVSTSLILGSRMLTLFYPVNSSRYCWF
ncbi:SURF4 family-domain-containing protein [Mycena rosella]|uniref:SURF4 family-domain-containing protein n=1 Tax=Mycena rosella TaxID=1033263 RepID=A0AAD7CT24_MYCRO|nr:SURF4 family-domain-containing protein [Mycena rosella]